MVASGAKPFEQYFAEALIDPGDGVLIFSPHFPTYVPNLQRRGARAVLAPLAAEHGFRPRADDVRHFLETDPKPRGVFLNSPHNPTGGVATRDDLAAIADVVRGTDLVVFSDEPYCHMVWGGRHESILAQPGMLDHAVAAYTFSKSYSMSGWRIGFAVANPEVVEAIGKLINTSASCSPPLAQWAARAALEHDAPARDEYMDRFRRKVERLAAGLARIEGFRVVEPAGTFYVFPDVRESATAGGSPRTGWPSTCSKGPTTTSAWPASAASPSATPGGASSASAAPSPTSGSTRPSTSSPRRSIAATGSSGSWQQHPEFIQHEPA